jgi:hypothetical protein
LAGYGSTAAAQTPTVQTGPDAEISVDGLYRVDNSVMELAYVKPDLNLQIYTKVRLGEIRVAYRKDPEGRRRATTGMPEERNYALSSSQMDVLKDLYRDALVKELTKDDGYQLVDAPGPDVLHIEAYVIDLVIKVPTQSTARGQQGGVSSYAEVTALLELYDSESQEILARLADRGDPTSSAGWASIQPGFVKADLTRLFEYWAGLLREGLDKIREVGLQ